MTFKRRVGLSQHQRLKHPLARNEARAAGNQRVAARAPVAPRFAKKPPKVIAGDVFSIADVNLMLELEVRFRGERNISNRILEHLTGKTVD
jgi:glutathione S-transferase